MIKLNLGFMGNSSNQSRKNCKGIQIKENWKWYKALSRAVEREKIARNLYLYQRKFISLKIWAARPHCVHYKPMELDPTPSWDLQDCFKLQVGLEITKHEGESTAQPLECMQGAADCLLRKMCEEILRNSSDISNASAGNFQSQ